jgi:ATP-dependent phosphofructokinase / diphosphate-dependent phosphofructokinase
MAEVHRVGMLTGGGDAPGLNGVIRAVTTKCVEDYGYEVVGLKRGWKALLEPEQDTVMPLGVDDVRYILQEGGTILGSSRTNPYKNEGDAEKVVKQMEEFGVDALVAIGGDDTLGVAKRLYDDFRTQVIGCPKTIDNDLSATDTTFGYDTAVSIATDAIDKLRTTARSHERILVVEVMGRHAGWITWGAGLASAANVTLIPEVEPDLDEITRIFKERAEKGEKWGLVAVSEGVTFSEDFVTQTAEKDEFGHVRLGGVGEGLAGELKERTGIDTRHVVLGHLQRGGTPTANDRILSTRYGLRAAEAVKSGEWGKMVALRGNDILTVDLSEATEETKTVPDDLYQDLRTFFG